jgi:ABC-type transporter Mla MlaB component
MLHLSETLSNGRPSLELAGDLTIYEVTGIQGQLADQIGRHPALELNLAGVTALDTAGAQLLVWLKRSAAARGACLTLVHHSPAVVEVVDHLHLAGILGDPILITPAN